MWIHAWLLVLPLALALGRRLSPRAERIALVLVWLALALLIGLRRGIGIDWDNYLILFVRAGAYPVPEAMTLSEPGYMLVSAIAARLGFALARRQSRLRGDLRRRADDVRRGSRSRRRSLC